MSRLGTRKPSGTANTGPFSRTQAGVVLLSAQPGIAAQIQAALRYSGDFRFVAVSETPAKIRHLFRSSIDILLVDANLDACAVRFEELRAHFPESWCVLLCGDAFDQPIFDLLLAGADGCIDLISEADEIVHKLRQVELGGTPLPPKIAAGILHLAREHGWGTNGCKNLSRRELQVVQLLSEGALYKEIAHHLGISMDTVRRHITNAYKKLFAPEPKRF